MNRGPIVLTIDEAEVLHLILAPTLILTTFCLVSPRPTRELTIFLYYRQSIDWEIIEQPPPSADDDELVKKLRKRLQDLLNDLRSGAEGVVNKD
ncbi:hypothetical protein NLJ89_g5175 [Agrocybe chaxingu]|uniref:Uncharacterized protein n=1 Tax=Agrocybe chaxingu TaxID=84603 RepID=A0A9W8K2S5_9AGAR|nr:hypothetical protein NLJ89_g5175 [Agrocybe chaxingu]